MKEGRALAYYYTYSSYYYYYAPTYYYSSSYYYYGYNTYNYYTYNGNPSPGVSAGIVVAIVLPLCCTALITTCLISYFCCTRVVIRDGKRVRECKCCRG